MNKLLEANPARSERVFFLGQEVANTVGKVITLPQNTHGLTVVMAGLLGAIAWNRRALARAQRVGITRAEQDAFAAESVRRALAAQADGSFKDEIAPVTVSGRKGDVIVDSDEQPGRCDIGKIPTLRAAFKKDGTITAASSSSINDGAAALVLMRESTAQRRGVAPVAPFTGNMSMPGMPP